MKEVQLNNEDFTIENLVDAMNEVRLQVTKDESNFTCIQNLLHGFMTGQVDFDNFAFELTMLLQTSKTEVTCDTCSTKVAIDQTLKNEGELGLKDRFTCFTCLEKSGKGKVEEVE